MLHRVKTLEIMRRRRARDEAIIWQNALMSALGHKRTLRHVQAMSALPPKADVSLVRCDVRFVPKADITVGAKRLSVKIHHLATFDENLVVRTTRR